MHSLLLTDRTATIKLVNYLCNNLHSGLTKGFTQFQAHFIFTFAERLSPSFQ